MQSSTIVIPDNNQQNKKNPICGIDHIRPSTNRKIQKGDDEPIFVSESVYQRRKYGREQKQKFYEQQTGIKTLPEFVLDLTELTDDERKGKIQGNLHHKMAVIYLDGNGFGKIQQEICQGDDAKYALELFDTKIKNYRHDFLRSLLEDTIGKTQWTYQHENKHRLEILLWGGDEMILVVSAWLGWWTLDYFFQKSENWHIDDSNPKVKESYPLTHAAGLVFCHYKAPIHRITKDDPDFYPRRDAKGKPYLPAKSFRGAIRSQAERIIRTLDGHVCFIDEVKPDCKPVEKMADVDRLCLACQLFGGTGWKTPIRISDFRFARLESKPKIEFKTENKLAQKSVIKTKQGNFTTTFKKKPKIAPVLTQTKGEFEQDFVAIDRFTGGGSDQAKFKARVSNSPLLEGTLEIDLQRIKPWGLGLLALLIRDLMEGDITFGYGAAKGYGHCYAQLLDGSINSLPNAEKYQTWEDFTLNPDISKEWHRNKAILPKLQDFINNCVNEFQEKCE